MPSVLAAASVIMVMVMAAPSILMVAPSGTVKEEIFLDTPIFFANVSIDNGIVALDVAVEKSKRHNRKEVLDKNNRIQTSKNFKHSKINDKTLHRQSNQYCQHIF